MQETGVQSLGWENSLEKEMATHSSILAWRIPRTEEPGGLQSMGLQRVGHNWATSLSLHQELCSWRALVMGSGLILTCKIPNFQRQLQRGTFQGSSKGRGPLNKNPIWCGGIKNRDISFTHNVHGWYGPWTRTNTWKHGEQTGDPRAHRMKLRFWGCFGWKLHWCLPAPKQLHS